MKIIITEDKLNKITINWLNDNYGDLEPYKKDKYPDYIFYLKGDKIIFDYNNRNGLVYVNYNEIWSFFESYFGMNYQQIQDITKEWVEEHYNLRVSTTKWFCKLLKIRWKNITI
jgi:hypothetical protein